MEQFVYHGYIMNFEWGCEEGIHTGWTILEAENEYQALLSVPAQLRAKARAIRITKYTPEKIQAFHE